MLLARAHNAPDTRRESASNPMRVYRVSPDREECDRGARRPVIYAARRGTHTGGFGDAHRITTVAPIMKCLATLRAIYIENDHVEIESNRRFP